MEVLPDPRTLGCEALVGYLVHEIEQFTPSTARGMRAKTEALRQLPTLERPMDELANPTHVTASGFIVGERGIVLHEHKSLRMWLQPGGHIEPGEWPSDAALREAQEETGLECAVIGPQPTLVRVDVHPGPRGHTHLDLGYVVWCQPDDPQPPAGESQNVGWFSLDHALAVCAPDLREFLPLLEPYLAE
jgi:8-oxo-dGTP pyrophosphatase MutT (NUDIX family)